MGLVLMYLTPSSSHATKQHSSCKVLMARGVPPFCPSAAVGFLVGVSSDLADYLTFMMVSWQETPRCGVSCHGFGTILTSSCWYCSQLTHGVGEPRFLDLWILDGFGMPKGCWMS